MIPVIESILPTGKTLPRGHAQFSTTSINSMWMHGTSEQRLYLWRKFWVAGRMWDGTCDCFGWSPPRALLRLCESYVIAFDDECYLWLTLGASHNRRPERWREGHVVCVETVQCQCVFGLPTSSLLRLNLRANSTVSFDCNAVRATVVSRSWDLGDAVHEVCHLSVISFLIIFAFWHCRFLSFFNWSEYSSLSLIQGDSRTRSGVPAIPSVMGHVHWPLYMSGNVIR